VELGHDLAVEGCNGGLVIRWMVGCAEERHEPGKRELVHRIDGAEVGDAAAEQGRALCDGVEAGLELLDLRLGLLGGRYRSLDRCGPGLGGPQRVDRRVVLENVSACV
jgi:hypothetical protein